MRIGHRINERDSITFIDMQAPGPQKARLTIHDLGRCSEKNTRLLCPHPPRSWTWCRTSTRSLTLWFEFRDLSAEAIRKVEITYGPWEKNDLERRVEESFSVEFAE